VPDRHTTPTQPEDGQDAKINFSLPERRRPAEVRLAQEQVDELKAIVRTAAADALRDSITQDMAEKFWAAGIAVLQDNAKKQAGDFVVGGVLALLKRGFLIVLVGSMVYTLGGWAMFVKFAKWVSTLG